MMTGIAPHRSGFEPRSGMAVKSEGVDEAFRMKRENTKERDIYYTLR